jgi:hypothetical protein
MRMVCGGMKKDRMLKNEARLYLPVFSAIEISGRKIFFYLFYSRGLTNPAQATHSLSRHVRLD